MKFLAMILLTVTIVVIVSTNGMCKQCQTLEVGECHMSGTSLSQRDSSQLESFVRSMNKQKVAKTMKSHVASGYDCSENITPKITENQQREAHDRSELARAREIVRKLKDGLDSKNLTPMDDITK
ncbi:unnamed protein product [Allacma fusca]|uniref:Uncharacterized protein n=1 Tax=Allacma fusca TaxID=39272 RepID=A0A8J2PGF1_9HEXA|nr:unnamed protein product [Allacma fusca]